LQALFIHVGSSPIPSCICTQLKREQTTRHARAALDERGQTEARRTARFGSSRAHLLHLDTIASDSRASSVVPPFRRAAWTRGFMASVRIPEGHLLGVRHRVSLIRRRRLVFGRPWPMVVADAHAVPPISLGTGLLSGAVAVGQALALALALGAGQARWTWRKLDGSPCPIAT
jgi:hypothetical protein